jgi:hypothetical protein
MIISVKASKQKSAQLLAINDGGMENTSEASKYLSACLLAVNEGRNEYCQQSIQTLVRSTAGYLVRTK